MNTSTDGKRGIWIWLLAIMITLSSAIYQRMTGPTYPISGNVAIGTENYSFRLLRTSVIDVDAPVRIKIEDPMISGFVEYRRYRSNDPWTRTALLRNQNYLETTLPRQPAAGKLMYFVYLEKEGKKQSLTGDIPILLRYKGDVPSWVLIPHILIMFLAMLFSNLSALEVLTKKGDPYRSMLIAISAVFVGGLILGPLVQKYAFGEYWAGVPFGFDLTDNKTLIAMIAWLFAWWKNRKQKDHFGWILVAAVVTLAVFLIPHSLFGSELDYTKLPASTGGQ